jgi:hypothetical protein
MKEAARTEYPVFTGLEWSGNLDQRGTSAAGWNSLSTDSVGVSDIIGGTADRDAPRNTSLKGMIDQKHRTRKTKQRRKQWVQHSCPLVICSVCDEDGHDSLYADGWIGERKCLVTIDTGATVTVTRPWLPERGIHKVHPADSIRGELPHLEWCFRDTKPGTMLTENLGVHHQYHQLHLGTTCPACKQCSCETEAPCATTGQRGSVIAASQGTIAFTPM